MAKKKSNTTNSKPQSNGESSRKPVFTYTTYPTILRKILREIPNRPLPTTCTTSTYRSWGIGSNSSGNTTRVLKAVGLVDDAGRPTPAYTEFMQPSTGPAILGEKIKSHYAPLFNASHAPYRENDEDLRRLFNIHSGGGESTLKAQVQTFKALCEFATFDGPVNSSDAQTDGSPSSQLEANGNVVSNTQGPSVHIDLHIHLPENKSTRDYQAIIEDIARFIYRNEGQDDE